MLVLFVSLFVISLIHITNAAVYNVISDNKSFNNHDAQPGECLEYYLKNTSNYISISPLILNFTSKWGITI